MFYLRSIASTATGFVSGAASKVSTTVFGTNTPDPAKPATPPTTTTATATAAAVTLPKPLQQPPVLTNPIPATTTTVNPVSSAKTTTATAAVLPPPSPAPQALKPTSPLPKNVAAFASPNSALVISRGTPLKDQRLSLMNARSTPVAAEAGKADQKSPAAGMAVSRTDHKSPEVTIAAVEPKPQVPLEMANQYLLASMPEKDSLLHSTNARETCVDPNLLIFIQEQGDPYVRTCFFNLLRLIVLELDSPNEAAALAFSHLGLVDVTKYAQIMIKGNDAVTVMNEPKLTQKNIFGKDESEIKTNILVALKSAYLNPGLFKFLLENINDPDFTNTKKQALNELLAQFIDEFQSSTPRKLECFSILLKNRTVGNLTSDYFKRLIEKIDTVEKLKDKKSLFQFFLLHCTLEIKEEILFAYIALEEDLSFKAKMKNSYNTFMNALVELIKTSMENDSEFSAAMKEHKESDPTGFATLSHNKFWREYMPDLKKRYAQRMAEAAKANTDSGSAGSSIAPAAKK